MEQKKTKLEAEIGKLENNPEVILKKPKDGTMEWLSFKESTTHDFIEKIKSFGVDVAMGEVKVEVNSYTMMYAHSYVKSSTLPLKKHNRQACRQNK